MKHTLSCMVLACFFFGCTSNDPILPVQPNIPSESDPTIPTSQEPDAPIEIREQPTNVGELALAKLQPDTLSEYSSSLAEPLQLPVTALPDDGIGMATHGLTVDADSIMFTFEITSLSYVGVDESLLNGDIDAYVSALDVNGVRTYALQNSMLIPADQLTVPVRVEISDDDSVSYAGLVTVSTRGTVDIFDFTFSTQENLDRTACTSGKFRGYDNIGATGSICWRVTVQRLTPEVTPLPATVKMGFQWPAQFLDSGPWTGSAIREDYFLSSESDPYIQMFPASFALVDVRIAHDGNNPVTSPAWSYFGPLDADGYIPSPPPIDEWKSGRDTSVVIKLYTQFCYDLHVPSKCTTDTGISLVAHLRKNSNDKERGPEEYCWFFTENGAKTQIDRCMHLSFSWHDTPTRDFIFVPTALEDSSSYLNEENMPPNHHQNGVTRLSAVMSHMLRRHDELLSKDGVGLNLFTHRRVQVVNADFPVCGDAPLSSCAGSLAFYPRGTSFKYVIAHELGHQLAATIPSITGQLPSTNNELCSCSHVDLAVTNQDHCLQSCDSPSEGTTHFFAAKVWNKSIADGENDCTFVYYKGFLDDACLPGIPPEHCKDYHGHKLNETPIPIDCAKPIQWRNSHCLDGVPPGSTLDFGSEYDWLLFSWAINNVADPLKRWSMRDLARLTGSNWEQLTHSAKVLKGVSSDASKAYIDLGRLYGVDDQWPE